MWLQRCCLAIVDPNPGLWDVEISTIFPQAELYTNCFYLSFENFEISSTFGNRVSGILLALLVIFQDIAMVMKVIEERCSLR